MNYKCPACGTNDAQAYWSCNRPDCPDGRDQSYSTTQPNVFEYEHNGLYVYDATSQTFHAYAPQTQRESWSTWWAKRVGEGAASSIFFWLMFLLAKHMGVLVTINCGGL